MKENTVGLIWMSAGNSYFKEEIISKIIDFALIKFSRVIIMAPDEPAEHTYKAMGYADNIASKKARLNANLLQNRARRVVDDLPIESRKRIRVVEWIEKIIPNRNYQNEYIKIQNMFNENKKFRKDALEITNSVIKDKIEDSNFKSLLSMAVIYLLKELAFILASPKIYNADKVVYLYHNDWSIFRKFITGEYDGINRVELGFLLTGIK